MGNQKLVDVERLTVAIAPHKKLWNATEVMHISKRCMKINKDIDLSIFSLKCASQICADAGRVTV